MHCLCPFRPKRNARTVKGRHVRNTRHRLLVTFASIIVGIQTFAAPAFGQTSESASSYTFSTIDVPLPNWQLGFTSVADINEEGQITGGFTDSNLGPYGFLLNFKKKVHSTEIRCSGKDVVVTEPQSINTHGEIAGFASVIVERIKIPQPPFKILITKISGFFRDRTGKCTILDFPGANLTEAVGVNDDGQVVGFYFDVTESFPNGHARGFLYDNGIFTSFDFPGAVETLPVDFNDNGQIVGIFAAENDSIGRSFLLDAGTFTTFDVPLSGIVATQVSGINNRGQIVGRYIKSNPDDLDNPFPSHGFVATQ